MSKDLNRCDLSGVILGIQEVGFAKKLSISQQVADRFETTYVVIVDQPLSNIIDVGVGDEVVILSAMCYQVNGEYRFRISEENQFIITSKVLNRGTIAAEDMFI